jgi:hypothetical protein
LRQASGTAGDRLGAAGWEAFGPVCAAEGFGEPAGDGPDVVVVPTA